MTFTQISLSIRFQMPDRIQAYSFSSTLLVTAFSVVFCFYILKVCGPPTLSKSVGTISLTPLGYSVSLCHILVILTIFQNFLLSYFL